MDGADIFVSLRAEGFDFLPARDPSAIAVGDSRYPTFTRDGVSVAIQSCRYLNIDRGTVMVYEGDRTDVLVWGLHTDPKVRRQGRAGEAMRSLLVCADNCNVTLFVEPFATETRAMNENELQSFYRKLGFQPTDATGRVMTREPSPIEAASGRNPQ